MKYLVIFIFFVSVTFSPVSRAETAVPKLTQWVTDQTGTLSPDEIRTLTQRLQKFEDSTSNQIVVLIISTLDGAPLEDFALETATKNKVGKKETNNGILFLIVKNDKKHKVRFPPPPLKYFYNFQAFFDNPLNIFIDVFFRG